MIPDVGKKNIAVFKQLQRDEATAVLIYGKLSTFVKNRYNAEVLERIAREEQSHYATLREFTHIDLAPRRFYAGFIILTARILGITFALKMLEQIEKTIQSSFKDAIDRYPALRSILEDEERHEQELLAMLEEGFLDYVGSMVLGLNDALIELTGALAGLTFAFRDTRLIALSGLVTGIAASLSMASSEFLAHRAEGKSEKARKAALYTGITYIVTVILLVLPYLLMTSYILALILTLTTAIIIILIFNFYVSVARNLSFRKHFCEMAGLSLGVAGLSFGIGILVRKALGVDI